MNFSTSLIALSAIRSGACFIYNEAPDCNRMGHKIASRTSGHFGDLCCCRKVLQRILLCRNVLLSAQYCDIMKVLCRIIAFSAQNCSRNEILCNNGVKSAPDWLKTRIRCQNGKYLTPDLICSGKKNLKCTGSV